MPTFDLRTGNTLTLLRAMPPDFVQTVVTSIPYYGLRDYQIEPDVWGGSEFCAHDFFDLGRTRPKPDRSTVGKDATNGSGVFGGGRGEQKTKAARGAAMPLGGMCQSCGAWLGCLGLEPTPELFIEHVVEIFREVRRVLRGDGTLWLNVGDSFCTQPNGSIGRSTLEGSLKPHSEYRRAHSLRSNGHGLSSGYKHKDLMMMPHRVALALQASGWWVRMDNVWSKPAPMPESVDDRPTKSHEYVFLLTKSPDYFYDAEAVREKQAGNAHSRGRGVHPKSVPHDKLIRANDSFNAAMTKFTEAPDGKRNMRSVWTINTQPFPEAHFATFPPALPALCIKAGTSEMGACVECGAPWERVTQKVAAAGKGSGNKERKTGESRVCPGSHLGASIPYSPTAFDTLGWRPTCICFGEQFEADPHAGSKLVRPCVVLDCFNGAGTAGLVALRLGRDYVGHERGPQYVEMSRRRIAGDAPMYFHEGVLY
jgi:DNA modification methylase